MSGANPTVAGAAFDRIPGPKQLIQIEDMPLPARFTRVVAAHFKNQPLLHS
jgi:hypothetical protein